FPFAELVSDDLFSPENLTRDAVESVNVSELAKRQFRDIARVAGLLVQGYPGMRKSAGQLQASAALIYEVFEKYDPENLLLAQARSEVLEQHFEESRLASTLVRLQASKRVLVHTERPTPLAFPLIIERVGARLTSES
ncbi:MAG: DNA ligase-associated DEXH box helicase, partial [Clostridia bacterium]|nr:DNA ligase-associated DEXH box helicase [Deltaproteobacteria bacterium]